MFDKKKLKQNKPWAVLCVFTEHYFFNRLVKCPLYFVLQPWCCKWSGCYPFKLSSLERLNEHVTAKSRFTQRACVFRKKTILTFAVQCKVKKKVVTFRFAWSEPRFVAGTQWKLLLFKVSSFRTWTKKSLKFQRFEQIFFVEREGVALDEEVESSWVWAPRKSNIRWTRNKKTIQWERKKKKLPSSGFEPETFRSSV